MRTVLAALVAALVAVAPVAGTSQASNAPPSVGSDSGLPLPRYVSLKTSEARARRGPSRSHRVDWLYTRRGLPLRVTAEFDNWRRVEDPDGEGGWVHYSLLSGVRTVLITRDMAVMRSRAQPNAPEVARLEAGVIAHIMQCIPDWCRLSVDGTRGWVLRDAFWGVDPNETLD